MSCFESSKFLKNPQVFSKDILVKAVKQLGWEYKLDRDVLTITKIPNQHVYGEYAIRVDANNIVTYNSYYLKDGNKLIDNMKHVFYELNVEYAYETVLNEFRSRGFTLKKNYDFVRNDKEVYSFSMIGYSKDKDETEKKTEIKFKILSDGTIISDSNYIPKDLHELADAAMAEIEEKFGNRRREGIEIIRKVVPAKYKNKAYCELKKQKINS